MHHESLQANALRVRLAQRRGETHRETGTRIAKDDEYIHTFGLRAWRNKLGIEHQQRKVRILRSTKIDFFLAYMKRYGFERSIDPKQVMPSWLTYRAGGQTMRVDRRSRG